MMNVGGAYLGVKDMDVHGSAMKFSLVTAEDEDDVAALGWQPYHVTKGFKPTDSTISMVIPDSFGDCIGMSSSSAKGILMGIAGRLSNRMGTGWSGGVDASATVLLSGDDAKMATKQGYPTRESIVQFIFDNIKLDRETFFTYFTHGGTDKEVEKAMLAAYPEGDIRPKGTATSRISVIRAGAFAGKDVFFQGGGSPAPVSIDQFR